MKKTGRTIVMAAFLLLAMGAMAGCGKKQIDVMDGLELKFEGVDGYGTASISNEGTWEEDALEASGINRDMNSGDESKEIRAMQGEYAIEAAVEYEVSPRENLSNGDQVTVTAKLKNQSVEKYGITFKGKEKKFTVDGLKDVEKIDLFKGVKVDFGGLSPYATAVVNTQDADNVASVRYTLDKTQDLKKGDTVVVTAEFDEESLLRMGYIAEGNTKDFTLTECDSYATTLSDIPSEMVDKMNKQFEDAFRAKATTWVDESSLKSIECIGAYFLRLKEGVQGEGYKNAYYGCYKISINTGEQMFDYYSYCCFKDIKILKDGTCSVDLAKYSMPTSSSNWLTGRKGTYFEKYGRVYDGYEQLDSMFSDCVTKDIEFYEYESSVTE